MAAPPSSRRPTGGDPRIEEARGTVRDFVGSLGNLEGLVGSLRVGPRALSAVLPGVLAGCGSLGSAFAELLDPVTLPAAAAGVAALRARVDSTVETLSAALAAAIRAPASAAARLALERVVRSARPELDHARALAELLALADREPRSLVAPGLLLRDALATPEAAAGSEPALLRWDGAEGVAIHLPRPAEVPPALDALSAACAVLGGALRVGPANVTMSLVARPLAGAAGAR